MRFIHKLPKELASQFLLFETTLSDGPSVLDFSFALNPSLRNLELVKSCFPNSPWQMLSSVFDSSEHPTIWLECDVNSEKSADVSSPNLFLSCHHLAQRCQIDNKNYYLHILDVFNALNAQTMSSKCSSNLQHCFEVCEKMGFKVWCSGFMLTRGFQGIRLIIYCNDFKTQDLLQFSLREMGYREDCKEIFSLLHKIDRYLDHICLSIDVGEKIGERLGIECYLPVADSQTNLTQIFSALNSSSMIMPGKAEACFDWIGNSTSTEVLDDESFRVHVITRNINHFKLISDCGVLNLAKVYLAAWHQELKDTAIFPQLAIPIS